MIKFFTKRMNNKKGFTLIELIVVIAILGILIAIAVPRLAGFTGSAVQRTVLADVKTIETAAIAVASDTGEKFTELKIAGTTGEAGEAGGPGDFDDFLDS
ncbi:MAG TPA: prepilin-type N-terminal cleavage/methylation domain-containing protein, partial [Anaerovoracaceae bacterium]|nr:prepilin-type N-terminal cleavage/methylation domain-containing protein [Anaerovoracaceae bacterium]